MEVTVQFVKNYVLCFLKAFIQNKSSHKFKYENLSEFILFFQSKFVREVFALNISIEIFDGKHYLHFANSPNLIFTNSHY